MVTITRVCADDDREKIIGYTATVVVQCNRCSEPFAFVGPPVGLLPDEPTISPDALELRVPIRPQSDPTIGKGLAGFRVNFREQRLARGRSDA